MTNSLLELEIFKHALSRLIDALISQKFVLKLNKCSLETIAEDKVFLAKETINEITSYEVELLISSYKKLATANSDLLKLDVLSIVRE